MANKNITMVRIKLKLQRIHISTVPKIVAYLIQILNMQSVKMDNIFLMITKKEKMKVT